VQQTVKPSTRVPAGDDHLVLGPDSLRLPVDLFPDYVFISLAPGGVVTSWNVGAERLLGWGREQAVGLHVSDVLGGGPELGLESSDLEAAVQKSSVTTRRWLKHYDGSRRDCLTTVVAVRGDGEDDVRGYVVVAHWCPTGTVEAPRASHNADETSRQLSESRTLLAAETADRRQAELSRARLLRRLVSAEENERRRLARDLHDGLGQRLTALRLILEAFGETSSAPDATATGIASALELLAGIDQQVDFIAWELRPAAFDELGLAKVLDTYVREWSGHTGIRAIFHARPATVERLAPDIEATIYRIAQEALNNVAKHAHAQSVNVLLELRRDVLVLVVEDDGDGFQPSGAGKTSIGVAGMRERARAVGGTLEIEPTPGGGTTVLATIPMTGSYLKRTHSPGESDESTDSQPETGDPGSVEQRGAPLNAIRARLQELQRAVGARDEFIATVAHELRNPIAPLTFQVRLALDKIERSAAAGVPVSIEWIQAKLRGMEQRLHRLLETLDRLLDVSRLSTGRIDLQLEPMDLAAVVREVVDSFEAELAVARCKLTWSEYGDATGRWDRLRVEQVCRNLLSNAIRFGAGRPIEITVGADRDCATLMIRDHGIGIPADQQSKIFERFERGAEQRSGGFGIGLWIVRNLCAAMGGAVSVESTLGDGACFTVLLPRDPARPNVEPASE
jgi:PAS domain S-box-containing protein